MAMNKFTPGFQGRDSMRELGEKAFGIRETIYPTIAKQHSPQISRDLSSVVTGRYKRGGKVEHKNIGGMIGSGLAGMGAGLLTKNPLAGMAASGAGQLVGDKIGDYLSPYLPFKKGGNVKGKKSEMAKHKACGGYQEGGYAKGGRSPKIQHRDFGGFMSDIGNGISSALNNPIVKGAMAIAPMLLNEGGTVEKRKGGRLKKAEGGYAKGGRTAKIPHRDFGGFLNDITSGISSAMDNPIVKGAMSIAPMLLKEGGKATRTGKKMARTAHHPMTRDKILRAREHEGIEEIKHGIAMERRMSDKKDGIRKRAVGGVAKMRLGQSTASGMPIKARVRATGSY